MARHRITRWLPWLGVLLIAAVAIHPLLDAPPYGDDIRLHLFRVPVVHSLWRAGIPFARWIPDLNFGYGSALFNFYPPLSAYALTAVYLVVGQNAPTAITLLFALVLFIGTGGMYLLGRDLYGAAGGLLAAALFTWSPHLLSQTYARGSTANALAMAFFPLAMLSFLRLARRPSNGGTIVAAVLLALVLLSHTAASLLFIGPLALMALSAAIAPIAGPAARLNRCRAVIVALLLGLGLSAFSWLPALTEIRFTRYATEAAKVDFSDHFADPWRWPGQVISGMHNQALPASPGTGQIVSGAIGLLMALVVLASHRRQRNHSSPWKEFVTLAAGMIGLALLFLATPWSAAIWERVGLLRSLQFPWRLLDVPTLLLALSGGRLLAGRGATIGWWRLLRLFLASIALTVSYMNAIPYLYPPRVFSLPERPTWADVTAVEAKYQIFGLTAWGEYSAATVQEWPPEHSPESVSILATGSAGLTPLSHKLIAPPPGISDADSDPWRATWRTSFSQDETLTIAVHDFPGWQARLDGAAIPLRVDGRGLLQIDVPAGDHHVELAFGPTPVRRIADTVTAAMVLVLGMLGFLETKRRKGKGQARVVARPQNDPLCGAIICLLSLFLVLKLAWIDRVDNWLVAHPEDGLIPGASQPDFGDFNGEIHLAGYQVSAPDQLTLYWQAVAAPASSYTVSILMIDGRGRPVRTMQNPTPGYSVTPNWEAGQLIRDVYTLPIASSGAPAGYTLYASLLNNETGESLPILDAPGAPAVPVGRIKNPPPGDIVMPGSAVAIGTRFGEAIVLSHVDAPASIIEGESFDLMLYWEPLTAISEDYTVFTHLLSADGTQAAGLDGPPLDGLYPTSYWEPGEVIVDGRRWQLDVAPGTYQLQVGLYELSNGARLPASGPHAELGDRVAVQKLVVTPGPGP